MNFLEFIFVLKDIKTQRSRESIRRFKKKLSHVQSNSSDNNRKRSARVYFLIFHNALFIYLMVHCFLLDK